MLGRKIASEFEESFGRSARGAVRAPGRVNLIGEHTDYNDGFVLPIAIERQTLAAYAPREDRVLRVRSLQAEPPVRVNLDDNLAPIPGSWSNYVVGVAVELLRAGVGLRGADILFDSTVPVGGGLSSSAALEVAAALALLAAAGAPGAVAGRDLALLCQRAENHFAGAPCGIMDQSIAVMGQTGKALLLDCRSGETRHVPFDSPDVVLLVADTQVKHDIGEGGYPLRRRQCQESARRLGVPALRDATGEGLERAIAGGVLDADHARRARHVVGEIARTLEAVAALEGRDFPRFGELMYASHESLRDDFQVSCPELDAIVDGARACEGVYGARMTGGGFGGCAIVLVQADAAPSAGETIARRFQERFGRRCPIFATGAGPGAGELDFPKTA